MLLLPFLRSHKKKQRRIVVVCFIWPWREIEWSNTVLDSCSPDIIWNRTHTHLVFDIKERKRMVNNRCERMICERENIPHKFYVRGVDLIITRFITEIYNLCPISVPNLFFFYDNNWVTNLSPKSKIYPFIKAINI